MIPPEVLGAQEQRLEVEAVVAFWGSLGHVLVGTGDDEHRQLLADLDDRVADVVGGERRRCPGSRPPR